MKLKLFVSATRKIELRAIENLLKEIENKRCSNTANSRTLHGKGNALNSEYKLNQSKNYENLEFLALSEKSQNYKRTVPPSKHECTRYNTLAIARELLLCENLTHKPNTATSILDQQDVELVKKFEENRSFLEEIKRWLKRIFQRSPNSGHPPYRHGGMYDHGYYDPFRRNDWERERRYRHKNENEQIEKKDESTQTEENEKNDEANQTDQSDANNEASNGSSNESSNEGSNGGSNESGNSDSEN